MSILEERERAFETKFAHDEALHFRTLAQRNRLLAEWVARLVGLPDEAAISYTDKLIECAVTQPDTHALMTKIANDLGVRGHDVPRRALQQKLEELTQLAREQVYAGAHS